MKKFIFSAAAVVMVALSLVGCNSGSPKDTAQKFLDGLYHMEYDAAKSVSTEETKKQVDAYASLTSMGGDDAKKKAKEIKVTVSEPKVDGDNATAEYTLSGGGGDDKTPHTLKMVKKDGKWLASWSKNDLMGDMGGGMGGADVSGGTDSTMAPPADGSMTGGDSTTTH